MNSIYEKLTTCLSSVCEKTDFVPETAIVLGSGLGDYAEQIKIDTTIDYKDIKGFPTSTVPGHKGRFVFGYVDSVPVVIMQGRVHYYEGYPITDVVLPTRLMGMMGAKKLILTNAAGGLNTDFNPGDFMLISDHIATAIPSPLIAEDVTASVGHIPSIRTKVGFSLITPLYKRSTYLFITEHLLTHSGSNRWQHYNHLPLPLK